MNRRQVFVTACLLLTLVATYFAPEPDADLSAPSKAGVAQNTAMTRGGPVVTTDKSSAAVNEVLRIRPRQPTGDDTLAFAPVDWSPPKSMRPPEPEVNAPEPEPQAPPLPFKVIGQYSEAGRKGVFLQNNEESLVVSVGDAIGELYQVESLNDGVLTLVYLPLGQRQTLSISN